MRPVLAQHRGNAGRLMLIRFGFDITVACQQPTPMVCLLTLHDDRLGDLRAPETVLTTPEIPMSTYHDLFGNVCRRFVAPAGEFRIWSDGVVEDSGEVDPIFADAREWPVADLPDECLALSDGQPLLRDGQAQPDGVGPVRPRPAGLGAGPGDLQLRQPPHHVRLPASPRHAHRLRGLPGARRRVPRLRPSRHHVVPLPEHPGPLRQRLSRRHRRADRRSDGLQRLDRGVSRRALA